MIEKAYLITLNQLVTKTQEVTEASPHFARALYVPRDVVHTSLNFVNEISIDSFSSFLVSPDEHLKFCGCTSVQVSSFKEELNHSTILHNGVLALKLAMDKQTWIDPSLKISFGSSSAGALCSLLSELPFE